MSKKISTLLGAAILLTLGLAAVAVNVGAKDEFKVPSQAALTAQQAISDQAIEAIKQGKGRPLNGGTDQWMMFWRNCEIVFVKEHRTPTEVDSPGSPNGKTIINVTDSSKENFQAQLGPQDPACLNVAPTQEELDGGMAELNARNAVAQGLPPNVKPPVDLRPTPTRPAG